MIDFENLATAMGELDEDTVKEILEAIDNAENANAAMEACQRGMDTVGKLFEEGEYFVGDLIYAGELMTDAVEVLKPSLEYYLNEMGKAFDLIEFSKNGEIVKNVVFFGLRRKTEEILLGKEGKKHDRRSV